MKKVTSIALAGCLLLGSSTTALANNSYNTNPMPVLYGENVKEVLYGENVQENLTIIPKEIKSETGDSKIKGTIIGSISFDKLVINGNETLLGSKKIYRKNDGTIMLPLRILSEELGYEVKWNGKLRTVELTKGPHWILVKIGDDHYSFGKMAPKKLGTAPEIIEETTYVPLNYVTDILRGYINTNPSGNIEISTEKNSVEKDSLICTKGKITAINKTEKSTMVWIEGEKISEELNNSIVLIVNEKTQLIDPVTDKKMSVQDLKVGDTVRGFYGPAVTRSIPPQARAEKIEVLRDADIKEGTITEVVNNRTKQIIVGNYSDGMVLNISDQTKIVTENNKELSFEDLKQGMEIEAFHDLVVTASIPPISSAKKIIVKK